MDKKLLKRLGLAAMLGGFALAMQGCMIHAQPHRVSVAAPAPAHVTVATNYYTPQYYNGYVVYYNDTGSPYYYYSGAPVFIPPTYPNYHVYATHYNRYRPHYQRWYHSQGHRYHTYRAPGYHGVAVHPAPRPGARYAPAPVVRRGPAPVVRPAPAPAPVYHQNRRPPPRRGGPPPRRGQGAPPPPPSPPR